MASLKCSNCGYGIHYHGMPEGIEYIFFTLKDWIDLSSQGQQAVSVQIDNDGQYLMAWKCPECGTYAFFDNKTHTRVTNVYVPNDDVDFVFDGKSSEYGLFFDDFLWYEITETYILIKDIMKEYSGYWWIKKDEEKMCIYADKECQKCVAKYKRVDIAEE